MLTTNDYPLLNPAEETRIARAYRRSGDRKLEEQLIRSQMRLVMHLARQLQPPTDDDLEDLVQEGNLGLVTAVRKFDPERGVRLSTYASLWIRAFQLRHLVANHRLVRLGRSLIERKLFFHLRSTRARLEAAGLPTDTATLARELGVRPRHVERMTARLASREVSLDAPVDEHRTLIDLLTESAPSPAECAEAAELGLLFATEVERFRRELRGRDRALFEQRWCASSQPTLVEVGGRFGISRERARQLEVRLLDRLRDGVQKRLAVA